MRVHEATTKKKAQGAQPPYKARKSQTRARTRENTPPRHNFWVELKDLITILDVPNKLKPPPKNDKRLGPSKNAWCEFHQALGHKLHNCLALGFLLDELVRGSFLKDYLQESQGALTTAPPTGDHRYEVPIHGEINTIAGGFSRGGCTASQRKKYARGVMTVEGQRSDQTPEPDLVFTRIDLQDVVSHDNDPMVISAVTASRKVPRPSRSRKLDRRDVLVDFQQIAVVS